MIETADGLGTHDYEAAGRMEGLKVATYIGEAGRNVTPDEIVIYETKPLLEQIAEYPDHIESSSATKSGMYSIDGMDRMDKKDFMTVHGRYDRAFVTEDPNLVVPLDVLRDMEREGVIGELANYFITTTGTATGNAKAFGEDFVGKLKEDGVGAVILTST